MPRAVIAVADPRHAHLFTVEQVAGHGESLVARQSLAREDSQTSFARLVVASIRELVDEHAGNRVILCASPVMLAELRACAPGLIGPRTQIEEIPGDLTALSAPALRAAIDAARAAVR